MGLATLERTRTALPDVQRALYLPLWKRDCQTGLTFVSDDAYGHLVTVTGALWGLQGYTFDGTDDKVTVPDHTALKFGLTSFSVWTIFKPSAGNGQVTIVGKDGNWSATVGWELYMVADYSGRMLLKTIDWGKYLVRTTTTILSTANYYFLLCSVDRPNNTLNLYLNGTLDQGALGNTGSFSATDDITNTTTVNIAGGCTQDDPFTACIVSECGILAGTVTATQAMNLYLQAKRRLPWL